MGVKPPVSPVPQLWPGSTVVCIGTGPSLTPADVDVCRGKARVIVINDAYQIALWADVLYAADAKWWGWHKGAPSFEGLKFSLQAAAAKFPGVHVLENAGRDGLSLNANRLATGYNSGYQAINLAVHLGASRIVLLGYDMGRPRNGPSHYFGEHRDKSQPPYGHCLKAFQTLPAPLAALGVDVVNCSRQTALTCFRRAPLESVLMERAA